MPRIWRDRLLHSHTLAVLSAAGVALVAFPGAELITIAQAEPPPVVSGPASRKGPHGRLSGTSVATQIAAGSDAAASEAAAEPVSEPVKPSRAPARSREFDGCLATHSQSACSRTLDAALERHARVRMGDIAVARASLAPLPFDHDPRWVQRLESLAADGLAFKRVRTGGGNEWVFGITRDGVLGFSFEERRGD
jgi:hypothetical protein